MRARRSLLTNAWRMPLMQQQTTCGASVPVPSLEQPKWWLRSVRFFTGSMQLLDLRKTAVHWTPASCKRLPGCCCPTLWVWAHWSHLRSGAVKDSYRTRTDMIASAVGKTPQGSASADSCQIHRGRFLMPYDDMEHIKAWLQCLRNWQTKRQSCTS